MRRLASSALLVLLLALIGSGSVKAQAPRETAPSDSAFWAALEGRRVRLAEPAADGGVRLRTGRLVDARGDTLLLMDQAGRPQRAVVTRSTRVDRLERHDPTTAVTVGGVALGGLAGGLVGHALHRDRQASEDCRAHDPVEGLACALVIGVTTELDNAVDHFADILVGAAVGALVGGVAGRALGRSRIRETWTPVKRLTVTAAPGEGGAALRVRWSLP